VKEDNISQMFEIPDPDIIFRKRFLEPGFGTCPGTLEPVPCDSSIAELLVEICKRTDRMQT